MKIYTYDNGLTLEYDDSIKVGDLITAYEPGIHRVVEIKSRDAFNDPPLLSYVKEFDFKGKKSKHIKNSCCGSWCKKAINHIDKLKQQISHIENLICYVEYDKSPEN